MASSGNAWDRYVIEVGIWEQAGFPRETEHSTPTLESELDYSASHTISASVPNA